MWTYKILKAAHDAVEKQSKHRDDLYYELAWTMYWLAKQYDPAATDAEVELIGSRDRMPLNCILDHAYRQGMVAR